MEKYSINETSFNSRLSFKPLINTLKYVIKNGKPGSYALYGKLIEEFESHPVLMQSITDDSILATEKELVEQVLATIFPISLSEHESLYAISKPFKNDVIYASALFRKTFMRAGDHTVIIPNEEVERNLWIEKESSAYRIILNKFAGLKKPLKISSIHSYTDGNGLQKFSALHIDPHFIDVFHKDPDWQLSTELKNKIADPALSLVDLEKLLPLADFYFEGLSVIEVEDVTAAQSIEQIKNDLLTMDDFADTLMYGKIENHLKSLLNLKNIRMGLTPFFKINDHYIFNDLHNSNSLLFRHFNTIHDKNAINDCCNLLFYENTKPLLFETLNSQAIDRIKYLDLYAQQGVKSLVLCPLRFEDELLGVLEIVSDQPATLNSHHVMLLEKALPLFTIALKKSFINLDNQIDKIIKTRFTAVQPAVEWRFTEAALSYLVNRKKSADVKIEKISFKDVYPLYGSIDIRESSSHRTNAIKLDLIEQLQMAQDIIRKAIPAVHFPLLMEIDYKIEKYLSTATASLLSEEEIQIHDFLHQQVNALFKHLKHSTPVLKTEIENYFNLLDHELKVLYMHRKEFDESIGRINQELVAFIDEQQALIQQSFSHYFERYVTDGVEFNLYIGQSLSPKQQFDELHLKNVKMWQLLVLAKAARLTHKLENELKIPLQTTQLILAHGSPINISFRQDERKFDVDGAYNIRYEIIKKRIDKVHIKNSNERLTQPGKIAIVFTQPREAAEYTSLIEFLTNQQLLLPGIEEYELQELQGIPGLKALRVAVNMGNIERHPRHELSILTSNHFLQ